MLSHTHKINSGKCLPPVHFRSMQANGANGTIPFSRKANFHLNLAWCFLYNQGRNQSYDCLWLRRCTKSQWPVTCIFIWLCPLTFNLSVVCKHVPEVNSPFVLILVWPKRIKGHLMTMIGAYDCTAIVSVSRLVLKWMSFALNSLDHCKGAPPWTGAQYPRCSTAVGQLPALRLVYWADPR